MKRIVILCSSFLFFAFDTFAQDSIKAYSGCFATELNINPLQGQVNLNNAINQLKFRYFNSESIAFRVAFGFNKVTKNASEKSSYGTNPIDNDMESKYTLFSCSFGVEKHFKGTKRLSPYIGAELAIAYKTSESEISSKTSTMKIDGAWWSTNLEPYYYNGNLYYHTVSSLNERGYTSIGLNGIMGFDYYISSHLFVGYEMLLVLNKKWYQKVEITSTSTNNYDQTNYPDSEADDFEFGPSIINGVRLGYIF